MSSQIVDRMEVKKSDQVGGRVQHVQGEGVCIPEQSGGRVTCPEYTDNRGGA
jgi:hypothetical protein